MKHIVYTLILSIVLLNCKKEKEVKSEPLVQKTFIDIKNLKHIKVGFSDKFEKLPSLEFSEITKNEYDDLKSTANSIINSPLQIKDNNYLLEVNNKILQLQTESNTVKEGENKYSYLGFYPTLNMYAFSANSTSENLGFSELELISTLNSCVYSIISVGDDKVENPIISPQTNYLAYHYNYVYEDNKSFLGVLKINPDKTFTEYRSFSSNEFNILETAWFGDDYVGVKVTSDNGKTFKYYKANLSSINKETTNSQNFDGNYSVYVETEATTTGMASITYSFKINGTEAMLETNTYHEPIRCNGKYHIKINNNILELFYNDEEENCKSDSPAFYIKKEGDHFFIKGVGGEATFQEWILLKKNNN